MHSWVVSRLPVPKDDAGSIFKNTAGPGGSPTVSPRGFDHKAASHPGNGLKYWPIPTPLLTGQRGFRYTVGPRRASSRAFEVFQRGTDIRVLLLQPSSLSGR